MLDLLVKGREFFDERTGEFVTMSDTMLRLEHSLISISKWESKWHKPFLNDEKKSYEELIDYIRCMTISQNVAPSVYKMLTIDNLNTVEAYMSDEMTATTFGRENRGRGGRRAITSELIYSWMVSLQIPFECEKWHINRLLTLIRVCNIENSPKKKMKGKDILKQNSQLNAARRQAMGSKG